MTKKRSGLYSHINIPIPVQAKYAAEIAAKLKSKTLRDWLGEAIFIASFAELQRVGFTVESIAKQYEEATGLKFDENLFDIIRMEVGEVEEEPEDPLQVGLEEFAAKE